MDLLLHRKNRIVDLLAIGKRAVRKGMLGNDLRNRVFDAQIVFLRTVDRQHRQVFDAQRCGGSSVGLLFGSAGNDQHHFAARRLVDHALANLRDGSATDLLKILGKFTAKRHLAVRTEHVRKYCTRSECLRGRNPS